MARRLPSGYTEVEYIESSGTQYIDTGIIGRYDTVAHVKFKALDIIDNDILGCWDGANRIFLVADVNNVLKVGYGQVYSVNKTIQVGTVYDYTVSVSNGSQTVDIDGVRTYSGTVSGNIDTGKNMYLFARNQNGVPRLGAQFTIYLTQIWQDGTLVRDFVPCISPTNAIGMYDLVTEAFFGNSGTGSFTAGPAVKTSQRYAVMRRVSRLPSGYTEVEYIESSGTQYIDTGVVPTATMNFDVGYSYPAVGVTGSGNVLFGSRSPSGAFMLSNFKTSASNVINPSETNKGYCRIGAANSTGTVALPQVADVMQTARCDSDGYVYLNDVKLNSTAVTRVTPPQLSIYLFKADVSGTSQPDPCITGTKMYYFKLEDNGILVMDLVPCIRQSDQAVGMYDTVTNTFFGNSGTGSFTAGPEVKTSQRYAVMRRVSRLPTGYKEVEYIESAGTQHINLGNKSIKNTGRFKIAFKPSAGVSGVKFITGLNPSGPSNHNIVVYINATALTVQNGGNTRQVLTASANVVNTLEITDGEYRLTTDTTETKTYTPVSEFTQTGNLYVGWATNDNNDRRFVGKIYSYEHWDSSDTKDIDLVPCISPTNAIGMYDLVTDQFFPNAGTGDFTAGPEVKTKTRYHFIRD